MYGDISAVFHVFGILLIPVFLQILLDSCITIPKETLVLKDDPVTGNLAKTIGSRTPEGYFTLWDYWIIVLGMWSAFPVLFLL